MNIEPFSISVKNIEKKFEITIAFGRISIDFKASIMHGVIGPEGAGKTTLMRLIT